MLIPREPNRVIAIIAIFLIAFALILSTTDANADGGGSECVPSPETSQVVVVTPAVPAVPEVPAVPAVTEERRTGWQRYSWTGGPWGPDSPPPFPSGDWQPNVQGDPHDIGVEGPYFVSHGNSGNGDWFYLEGIYETVTVTPEVPAVPGTPEVPAVTKTIVTPAVECPEPPVVVEPPVATPENPSVPPSPETPSSPNDDEDPVISKHTSSEPGKTVVTLTHESGKVTVEVREYADDVKEEGL